MAKFFVGQRVRILYSDTFPELAGHQGVIVGLARRCALLGDSMTSDWLVKPDCWSSALCPDESAKFAPRSDQLEPITDRNTKVEWSECAWQPNGVEV